ncbi:MAG: GlxA family transcriptional regulator [Novosphingobium sp.]|uniref:GlxA family transcriptional regulator n=1 Tax=Novosphingobium sp. TaxID=1874826 RepID=UPI0032BD0B54
MQKFAFLLLPGFSAIAFFSAIEPLRIANRLTGKALFGWSIHTPAGDHAEASNGMQIRADGPLDERAETLVVCAGFDPLRLADPRLLAALRRVWRLGGSVGAIDTGAFLLAEAGILGREAITLHWEAADAFARRYPQIPVSGELFERHARLFTCAGGTAAMDLMLETIAASHGQALARSVSDQLIHERIRGPSDPQRGDDPALAGHPLIARVVRIMKQHLAEPLSLEQIAALAGLDRRRIERQFRSALGCSPAWHYRDLRLRFAVSLIQQQGLSVQAAALACGYSSQAVFSRACKQHFGASPRTVAQRSGSS